MDAPSPCGAVSAPVRAPQQTRPAAPAAQGRQSARSHAGYPVGSAVPGSGTRAGSSSSSRGAGQSTMEVPSKKRLSTGKRIAAIAVSVVMVLILATAGFGFWYTSQLDKALSLGEDHIAIKNALTASDLNKPFYALLIGSDSREGSGTSNRADESGDNQRSDVMILVRVDAPNRQFTMVSIPRDTRYTWPDGHVTKLNEVYNHGGSAATLSAVSEVTGVPISHFAEVSFSNFESIVDALGGIEVDVPVAISYKDALTGETVSLEPGVQVINGQEAQLFARARHEYGDNQDAKRQSNNRQMIEAIARATLSQPPTELPGTILELASFVKTDVKSSDLLSLGISFASGAGGMTVYSCTGPTQGAVDESVGLWLCYENPEGWAKLMSVVDSGADPKDVDVESTAIIP